MNRNVSGTPADRPNPTTPGRRSGESGQGDIGPTMEETLAGPGPSVESVGACESDGTETLADHEGVDANRQTVAAADEPRRHEHDAYKAKALGATRTIPGYEILEELGRGGMGVVYRARHLLLGRPCAIKTILGGVHADEPAARRFLKEAEAAARVRHPNVVQIHQVGYFDSLPYLELELVEGGSLDRLLDGIPWPARRAAKLVEGVARGVAEVHRLGIIHRDLKPGNVLLASDGTPKVADFGLAKADGRSGMTATQSILGSPNYMAPEQARGHSKDVGAPADVHALGAILYELLTGRPPYRGTTMLETLEQVKNTEPVPPSRLIPGLSRDVETIALKCLQKDPSRRYPTAQALGEDLDRFERGEPILARPITAGERAWNWARRRPERTLLIVTTGLLLAALLSLGTWSYWRVRRALTETSLQKLSSQRLSAALALDRGLEECRVGKVAQGLLWMAESLAIAPEGDEDSSRLARLNLSGWRDPLTVQRAVMLHDGVVECVAFSPDGRLAVSGGRDRVARLWDSSTGEPVGEPLAHDDSVFAAAFSLDGRYLLTGGQDRTTRLWDTRTGQLAGPTITHSHVVNAVAFSPDGRRIVVGVGIREYPVASSARVWDITTGEPLTPALGHDGSVRAVLFTADGSRIVTGAMDRTIRLWDAQTGRLEGELMRLKGEIKCMALGPDGDKLAVGTNDGECFVYSLAARRRLGVSLLHPTEVRAVAFHPGGALIVTGCMDSNARLWDWSSGLIVGSPLTHQNYVFGVAFNPEGTQLISGAEDRTVRLWDLSLHCRSGIPAFRRETDRERRAFDSEVVTPRLRTVVTGARGRPVPSWIREFLAASFSPDGRLVATGCADNFGRIWDVQTGRQVGQPLKHENWVRAVAFHPDGRRVLTGSHDMTARLWDGNTGEPLTPPLRHAGEVVVVAISPDGRKGLTGSSDRTARLWDLATGQPIGPPMLHLGRVRSVDFSPDSRLLLTASADGTARLWDGRTAKAIGPPLPHESELIGAFFDDAGTEILTMPLSGETRRWPLPTPIGGSPGDVGRWVQVMTGQEQDAGRALAVIEVPTWRHRRAALARTSLGTTLVPGPEQVLAWYDAEAGAYETSGPGEAGLWHLDRLLAARGDDWSSNARRAGLYYRLGRLEDAEAALLRAEALGGVDAVRTWCTARADAFERGGREADALWFRRRAARTAPSDAEAAADLGRCLARLGKFPEAAAALGHAVSVAPNRLDLLRELALARLAGNDLAGYRDACAAMLQLTRIVDLDGEAARTVATTCLLRPDATADWAAVLRLAEQAADRYIGDRRLVRGALYRARRMEEALQRFGKIEQQYTFVAWDWLLLGMLQQRAGLLKEAKATLERPYRWMDFVDRNQGRRVERDGPAESVTGPGHPWGADWTYWVECHVLRREADALLLDRAFPTDPFALLDVEQRDDLARKH